MTPAELVRVTSAELVGAEGTRGGEHRLAHRGHRILPDARIGKDGYPLPMRAFELSTKIDAAPAHVWQALVAIDAWPSWNRLVPYGEGVVRPGERLLFRIRRVDGSFRVHRPHVVATNAPQELVLAASFGHRWLVHMEHAFAIEARGVGGSVLRQRWTVTGLLVPLLWPMLVRAMARFAELGDDLATRLSPTGTASAPLTPPAATPPSGPPPARSCGAHL